MSKPKQVLPTDCPSRTQMAFRYQRKILILPSNLGILTGYRAREFSDDGGPFSAGLSEDPSVGRTHSWRNTTMISSLILKQIAQTRPGRVRHTLPRAGVRP